jgi:endo-1,4-beta-xylanase
MPKIFILCALMLIMARHSSAQPEDDARGLKDHYKDYFPIGVSVSPKLLQGEEAGLIVRHFNSITAENAMKMSRIHPLEEEYVWGGADTIVAFAQKHDMKLRGHVLCWYQQTPDWIFKDDRGSVVSKDVLLQRLQDHITQVVSRYKGKIYAWDVVNEAISDDDDEFLRKSSWYSIAGDDYIFKAFEYAHRADPQAKLFYNDYNTENPGKRERIYQLLKQLKDAGIPVHGVGLQGHWSLHDPSSQALDAAIKRFSSLGLEVQVTEMDISIYPPEKERREKRAGEDETFSTEREQLQAAQYQKMFKVLRDNRKVITGVTFWNLSDRHSWLDNFPVKGRKNYPLLFDQDLKPKKAYWEVIRF